MKKHLLLIILAAWIFPAFGKDYRLQALEDAHASFRTATNAAGYAEAAERYEMLIQEEGIRNGHLFYTAGNAWFMAGNMGRTILNYRRAERYMPNDADLQHNLSAALELRPDLIPEKEPSPVAARLLGWHLNTSPRFRWGLFSILWIGFWGTWFWMKRTPRKEARITTVTCALVSAVLLISLITEGIMNLQTQPGVITAAEVVARKGDGPMYAPAFLDPLHSGTEFQRLEQRENWWHIELADGQTCWIPARAAQTLALP
ncbi:hypothetical protein [Pontiella agarivorans]|uniref:SH3 domain-containing protein n=1 Tax=Pontiella agarivorans TaxID=3038953 RepID=A0ABU5MVC0_9BACT|nr:hypothetical protein [Pontiella agarivorans]MDZ8118036.1 hypothetical protein [Pontiella agarivorans]